MNQRRRIWLGSYICEIDPGVLIGRDAVPVCPQVRPRRERRFCVLARFHPCVGDRLSRIQVLSENLPAVGLVGCQGSEPKYVTQTGEYLAPTIDDAREAWRVIVKEHVAGIDRQPFEAPVAQSDLGRLGPRIVLQDAEVKS